MWDVTTHACHNSSRCLTKPPQLRLGHGWYNYIITFYLHVIVYPCCDVGVVNLCWWLSYMMLIHKRISDSHTDALIRLPMFFRQHYKYIRVLTENNSVSIETLLKFVHNGPSVGNGSCNESVLSIAIIWTIVDKYPSVSYDVTMAQWVNPPSRIMCIIATMRALKYIFTPDSWMYTIIFHTKLSTITMSSNIPY